MDSKLCSHKEIRECDYGLINSYIETDITITFTTFNLVCLVSSLLRIPWNYWRDKPGNSKEERPESKQTKVKVLNVAVMPASMYGFEASGVRKEQKAKI